MWVARYRDAEGRVRYAKPTWNGGRSSFGRKADAQRAVDEAIDRLHGGGPAFPDTVGSYFELWIARHPRSRRTNDTNRHRITRVLDVELEGRELRAWKLDELRRRHVRALVDHMLREQGRAVQGVRGILGSLSAMCEDAIEDDVADQNPFKGLRLRRNDPRARAGSRPIRTWSFEEMHAFARAAGRYEAMVRVLSDCGLRLGELLPLRREDFDGDTLHVRRTSHEGTILEGTKSDHGDSSAGRVVPCPPTLAGLIRTQPTRIDTEWLFPTPRGLLWRERNFYRDVWEPARLESGMDPRPHEFRHSWVSHLRAAGVDDADLAEIAGHTVETMIGHYTHALGRSHDSVRRLIG